MPDYQLTLTIPGQPPSYRTVTGNTAAELAQAVHRHARGLLGGQVDIHLDELAGTVHRGTAYAGEFTLEPVEPTAVDAPDTSAPDHVAHGYTLRNLHALAKSACVADRSLSADMGTRYDIAWSAIAEHLCVADTAPEWNELVRVGWQAIYAEVREQRRLCGIPREHLDWDKRQQRFVHYWQPQADAYGSVQLYGVATAPRFAMYWRPTTVPPADEQLTERIAVHQILTTLPEHQRQAVVALAVHDDYAAAADAIGLKYATLTARLWFARRAFRALWFAPDAAPPVRGTDRRVGAYRATPTTHCRAGHPWTAENTRWDRGRGKGGAKVRRCRACERERSAARRADKVAA